LEAKQIKSAHMLEDSSDDSDEDEYAWCTMMLPIPCHDEIKVKLKKYFIMNFI
jgi:hypothetical protein